MNRYRPSDLTDQGGGEPPVNTNASVKITTGSIILGEPTVLFTVGLPGSGKSTWADEQVTQDPTGLLTVVNRDHLRAMLRRPLGSDEGLVTDVQLAAIRAALSRRVSVIVDDTNLNPDYLQSAQASLLRAVPGLSIATVMHFLHVHPGECIERDALRPESQRVGKEVIWELYSQWRGTWPQMDAWQNAPAVSVDPAEVSWSRPGGPCAG